MTTKAPMIPARTELPDLAEHKREFIETFFKRGAELSEELIHENARPLGRG